VASTWWLDVETGNSWESAQAGDSPTSQANNAAALLGTVDYLRGQGVQQIGVYSTRQQWSEITGGAAMRGLPVWYAGTGTLDAAMTHCAPDGSFTGGPVRLVQHSLGDFDANEPC
jgi:GH25 family lysozyme M1 (1,4-beta-N-acetylmuramidase)